MPFEVNPLPLSALVGQAPNAREDLMRLSATLPAPPWPLTGGQAAHGCAAEATLDQARDIERFLKDVERRALRMAEIAVRDPDDALDIVQEAMIQLVRRYATRPSEEWRPLFYRILQNRIYDWQRRRAVRSKVIAWWTGGVREDEDDAPDAIESAASSDPDPRQRLESAEAMSALEQALKRLPARQQQAFMLRALEGLDVAETASAMGCAEGSVKTHYFRALQALRAALGEHWP
jgi:RNA polymerase sigma-70 factor (ECF subfamily)